MHFTTFLGPWVTFVIYTSATLTTAYYNDDSYGDDGGSYPENGAYEEGKGVNDDYGGGGGGGGHNEGGAALSSSGGKGGDGGHGGGAVDGSVHSKHKVTYSVVDSHSEPAHTPIVDINSGPLALKIRFNSVSSSIDAIQQHIGSVGKVKKSSSVDQPDILIHTVKRPIIQEISEIVTPYRKRVTQLQPTREKIETIIATGHEDGGEYAGGGGHSGGGGGGGGHGGHGGHGSRKSYSGY